MSDTVDLHPDIVRAIHNLAETKLGREYDAWSRKRYGVSGVMLAGKTVAGEFGGRSTASGRGVISSAGARGPAQFIPSTRQDYMQRYGVDPWAGDKQAIEMMMRHHLATGVEGYNPGMPTYKDYILGQKLNSEDRQGLRAGSGGAVAPVAPQAVTTASKTKVSLTNRTIPGQSFAAERDTARQQLLMGGHLTLDRLLAYKRSINSMQDVPERTVPGDLKVTTTPGKTVQPAKSVAAKASNGTDAAGGPAGGGVIWEVFYDPLNEYWDSGKVNSGGIGGHSDHVHVSASPIYVVRLGRLAQKMGLHVGENSHFNGGTRVTSGHAPNSFHYKDEAIDVSGAPDKMKVFAQLALREARSGRGK